MNKVSSLLDASLPRGGWLRAQRIALGLSQETVARRLKMKRQSYAGLEMAEARRAISLASLQNAAAAMGCDFAYFVVPKNSGLPAAARNSSQRANEGSPSVRVKPPSTVAEGRVEATKPFSSEEPKSFVSSFP